MWSLKIPGGYVGEVGRWISQNGDGVAYLGIEKVERGVGPIKYGTSKERYAYWESRVHCILTVLDAMFSTKLKQNHTILKITIKKSLSNIITRQ